MRKHFRDYTIWFSLLGKAKTNMARNKCLVIIFLSKLFTGCTTGSHVIKGSASRAEGKVQYMNFDMQEEDGCSIN